MLLRFYLLPIIQMLRWVYWPIWSDGYVDTVQKSGSDAAIIRIHGKKSNCFVSDYLQIIVNHPVTGGKQIVCENWRNLISVGAKPLAITNCLNFSSPENEEVMGEFAECLLGIKKLVNF